MGGIAPVIGGRGGAAAAELLGNALGVKFEPYSAALISAQTAPNTQLVFGASVWVRGGAVLTGIKIRNGVAAAGTLPTTARFGIADATGKMLAVSGNLNALANWTAGVCSFPFSAAYTMPADGILIPCFVVNGTWSVTQPTPGHIGNVTAAAMAADGSNPPVNFSWATQTDLPAVGASLTITTTTSRTYYLALY